MERRTLIVSGVFLACLGVATLAYIFIVMPRIDFSHLFAPKSNVPLIEKNTDYALGEELLAQGHFVEAAKAYTKALEAGGTPVDLSQVEYKLAITLSAIPDPKKVVEAFRNVGVNESYDPLVRAYAIANMTSVYEEHPNTEVASIIFAVPPFDTFLPNNRTSIAIRFINEYAASLSPIAEAHLAVAKWYGFAIQDVRKNGVTQSEQKKIESFTSIMQERTDAAFENLRKVENDPVLKSRLPFLYYKFGQFAATAKLANVTILGLEDPEQYLQRAITLAEQSAPKGISETLPVYIRYYYAIYLTLAYGNARAADVRATLTPLYKAPYSSVFATYLNPPFPPTDRERSLVNRVASLDPQFAAFVKTTAWSEVLP